jgi:hypothetical protein
MSAKSAYRLRSRAGPESEFAEAWDLAVSQGRDNALSTAIKRATEGERIPVCYRGAVIAYRVRYNDRLLINALRASDPATYRRHTAKEKPWREG